MQDARPLAALPPWRTRGWIVAAFLAIAFAVYGASLRNEFVLWDDTYLIYSNPIIKDISWKTFREAFTTYDPELYIPLTFLSYQFNYLLGGLEPFVYHLTNLLVHTANALLVTWLAFLLLRRGWVAILCGLLFLVHPLQTEAVAWASARKDLLSAFFFLLSIISYLHFRARGGRRAYYGSLIAFLLGLLSKVVVVTLPMVLVLLDLREKRRFDRDAVLEKIPFFLLSILFGLVALFGKRDVVASVTALQQILIAGKSTVFYFQKFFVPEGLNALYPYGKAIEGLPLDLLVPTFLALLLAALAVILFLRRRRDLSFAIAFYLVTLVPTFTNVFKGKEIYFASDRYAYLPSIGILLFLLPLLLSLQERVRVLRTSHAARITLPVLVVLLLSALALRQSLTWRDSFSLFEQTLRHYPRAIAAHINLSVAYRHVGDYEAALKHLNIAEEIKEHAHIHMARAAIHMKQNRPKEAIEENERAMRLDPRDPAPLYGIALAYAQEGRMAEAEEVYRQTLALEPKHLGARNNLAALYLQRGERAQAEEMYRSAVAIDETFSVAHFNLGVIAEEDGRIDEAIASFERTVALEPHAAIDALEHLLDLYARKNDAERSADAARRILRMKPDHRTASGFLEALRERGMID